MIVAFAGLRGVGKSTAAAYVARRYGYERLSFAGPLKRLVQDVYGFSHAQVFGPSAERDRPDPRYPRPDGTCLTPREALERFGTEAGRACWEQTWVARAMRDAERRAGVVFDDARFVNEFEAVKSAGGIVVRLWRDGQVPADHATESEQSALPDNYFDAVICTDGMVEHTRSQIDSVLVARGVRHG